MKVVHVDSGIKLIVSKGVKGDGLVWRGEWNSTTTYANIDVVSRGGASWVSKKSSNIGHDPLTDDGTWWDCMVRDSLAEAARDKAKKWAENPVDIEVEPGKYSALHHKEKALDAQVGAETAKTAAETARTGAETAEANALASENKAAKWAQEDEDVEVEPGKYSAFHYKEKALAAQIRAEYAAANAELVALGGIPI